jgi:hypothetical protein
MTVHQYQKLIEIQEQHANEDVVRLAYSVCYFYNLSTEKVNQMQPKKFLRKCKKIQNGLAVRPYLFSRKRFTTDATKLTLGQFIEVQSWLSKGIESQLHMISASILIKRTVHVNDVKKVLSYNICSVLPPVSTFIQSFMDLLKKYEWLLKDDNITDKQDKKANINHPFIINFGWVFSAKQVAEHLGLKLNDAFDINIIEALNTLVYLKSKAQYEELLRKK